MGPEPVEVPPLVLGGVGLGVLPPEEESSPLQPLRAARAALELPAVPLLQREPGSPADFPAQRFVRTRR
jgi:hypothetical protein